MNPPEHPHLAPPLSSVLDGLFIFVGVLTLDGILIQANRSACEAAGIRREDIVGRPFSEAYWWSYSRTVQQQLEDAIVRARFGEVVRYDVQVRLLGGELGWIDFMLSPLRNEAGEITHLLPSATQIDKRKKAEDENRARHQALFQQDSIGIAEVGRQGNWLRVNGKLCEIVGYSQEELLATTFQAITHPEDLDKDLDLMAQLARGAIPSYSMEKRYRRGDGQWVWVKLTGAAVAGPTGEPDYYIALVEDINERKLAEAEIVRLNADLERRVAERTADLEAANRELEGFTFATSHDLRGPLGRINSFSSLLDKQYRDRLDGNGLLYLDFIRENASRLMVLVEDLLSHARVAQGALELGPVAIREVANAVLKDKALEIAEAKAEVTVDVPPARVLADAQALAQALDNFLQNALKYSAKAAPSRVEIGGRQVDGRFLLWVRDNGMGFDMAYHDKIFQIFQRLHTYAEIPGSGVGLALVKRAAERMDGRVWAESSPGQGATFYLELRSA